MLGGLGYAIIFDILVNNMHLGIEASIINHMFGTLGIVATPMEVHTDSFIFTLQGTATNEGSSAIHRWRHLELNCKVGNKNTIKNSWVMIAWNQETKNETQLWNVPSKTSVAYSPEWPLFLKVIFPDNAMS